MTDRPESDSPYDFAPKEPQAPKRDAELPRRKVARPAPVPEAVPEAEPEAAAPEVAPYPERTCPHCGFRITTKPRGGRCPECAAALDEVATDLLQFADAGWLGTMSNGSLILAGSIAAHVVAVAMGAKNVPTGDLIHALAAVIGAAGIWMMTAPEPGLGLARMPMAGLARISGIVVAALWLVIFMLGRKSGAERMTQFAVAAVLLAMGAMAVIIGMHIRGLARRIPNDALVNQSVNLGIVLAVTCLIMAGMQLAKVDGAEIVQYSFICVFPLIGLTAGLVLYAIFSLVRYGLEMRNCAAAGYAIASRQAMRAAQAKR
jgi:hypothetical protein